MRVTSYRWGYRTDRQARNRRASAWEARQRECITGRVKTPALIGISAGSQPLKSSSRPTTQMHAAQSARVSPFVSRCINDWTVWWGENRTS